ECDYDLRRTTAVWCRRPGRPQPAEGQDPRIAQYVADEAREFLRALYDVIDAPWVPGPLHVIERTQLKLRQLQLAGAAGLSTPEPLMTNDPRALFEFWRQQPIVSKLAGPTAFGRALGDELARYTEMVTPADLVHAHALRACPMTFQPHIDKKLEVRV